MLNIETNSTGLCGRTVITKVVSHVSPRNQNINAFKDYASSCTCLEGSRVNLVDTVIINVVIKIKL